MLDGSGKPIVPPSPKVPDPSAMARSGSTISAFRPAGVVDSLPKFNMGAMNAVPAPTSVDGIYEGFGRLGQSMPPNAAQNAQAFEHFNVGPRGGGAGGPPAGIMSQRVNSAYTPPQGMFSRFVSNASPVFPLVGMAADAYSRSNTPGTLANRAIRNSAASDKLSGYPQTLPQAQNRIIDTAIAGADIARHNPIFAAPIDAYEAYKKGGIGGVANSLLVDHGVKPIAGAVSSAINGLGKFAGYLHDAAYNSAKPPITVDKDGNFSRAPQNPDEYKKAMELKYGAGGGSASYNNLSRMGSADASDIKQAYERLNARQGGGVAGSTTQPAMSYDDWVMKQPVSKLDADGYARRAQLEIEKRRPETTQQNIMMETNYALSHPVMVTGETHNKDGSWSNTYGDRASNAIQGYGTFRNALAKEETESVKAQAALERAQNSEKFTAADKVGMVGQVQNQMMQALLGDSKLPPAQRIRAARAYWPSFMSALKQNGVDPSTMDFDSFIQEQTGAIADPAYPGTYKVPK